jgi:hypothetical protein
VFNASEEEIQVRKVELVGLGSPVPMTYTPDIPPDSWRVLGLRVPPDCSTPAPNDIPAIRLRVQRPSGTNDIDVRLPYHGAAPLLDYHQAVCTRSAAVDRRDLAGVWVLQTAYGSESALEGSLLMRFTADGTYVWDFEGGLFSGPPAVWGTYQLQGGGRLLVFTPAGGLACGPRDISTWRTAVDDEDDVLTMVWRRGICPDGDGVWIARRVLRDRGLPTAPGEQ